MTTQYRRYKSAPITEAVLEIRVQPDGPERSQALSALAEELKGQFPKQAPMQRVQFRINAGPQPEQPPPAEQVYSQTHFGFRLANAQDSRVLQLRREGFAYSHLPPYTEWSVFCGEARPLWDRYRKTCPNAKLVRCALRYINRIDIPGEKIELEDYFRLYPEIPDNLVQRNVVGMSLALQVPQEDLQCMAQITQALIEPPRPGVISVVLDIDVFRLGIESWQDTHVWDFLDQLRSRKNDIFEGCITDRTRELIDK